MVGLVLSLNNNLQNNEMNFCKKKYEVWHVENHHDDHKLHSK